MARTNPLHKFSHFFTFLVHLLFRYFQRSPPMPNLCAHCPAPGHCCRNIRLNVKGSFTTKLEALAWLATVQPAEGELGLPFIPRERVRTLRDNGRHASPSPVDEEWTYDCIHQTPEGRCGSYDSRPQLCRMFEAGVHSPCLLRDEILINPDRDF